jgi:hypothetical protein
MENRPIRTYSGTEVKIKPKIVQLPKQRIKSMNSANSSKVKDSAYETIQSSLDTLSFDKFDKPNDRPGESFSRRYVSKRLVLKRTFGWLII